MPHTSRHKVNTEEIVSLHISKRSCNSKFRGSSSFLMFVSPSFKILFQMTIVRSLEFGSLMCVCYHDRSLRWHGLFGTPIVKVISVHPKKILIHFERSSTEEGTHGSSFSRLCVSLLTIDFFLILPSITSYLHSCNKKNLLAMHPVQSCV